MIWYFTPYATDKNYFAALAAYMRMVPENDWVCILDGDTMFLYSDFGHKLHEFVNQYPNAGLLTCIANRCHYQCQSLNNTAFEERDIIWHHRIAQRIFSDHGYEVKEVNRRIAGHLMLIKKSTWNAIKADVEATVKAKNKKILGVDTAISNVLLKKGFKILVMQGFYLFHFLRLYKGARDKTHLE